MLQDSDAQNRNEIMIWFRRKIDSSTSLSWSHIFTSCSRLTTVLDIVVAACHAEIFWVSMMKLKMIVKMNHINTIL